MSQEGKSSKGLDLKAVIALQEKRVFPEFEKNYDYYIVVFLSIVLAAFQIWTAGFGVLFALKQRVIHVSLLGALTFFLKSISSKVDFNEKGKKRVFFFDRIFAILILGCMVYLLWNYNDIQNRAGFPIKTDIIFGFMMSTGVVLL